jgi:hypothetical protein
MLKLSGQRHTFSVQVFCFIYIKDFMFDSKGQQRLVLKRDVGVS